MNRRNFLKVLSTVAIIAIAPIKLIASEFHEKAVKALSFSEIINNTLHRHANEIATNVSKHNGLLIRLQDVNRIKQAPVIVNITKEEIEKAAIMHFPNDKALGGHYVESKAKNS